MHALGLLHRDIKPANILFDEDHHVYLSDFGSVKDRDVMVISWEPLII